MFTTRGRGLGPFNRRKTVKLALYRQTCFGKVVRGGNKLDRVFLGGFLGRTIGGVSPDYLAKLGFGTLFVNGYSYLFVVTRGLNGVGTTMFPGHIGRDRTTRQAFGIGDHTIGYSVRAITGLTYNVTSGHLNGVRRTIVVHRHLVGLCTNRFKVITGVRALISRISTSFVRSFRTTRSGPFGVGLHDGTGVRVRVGDIIINSRQPYNNATQGYIRGQNFGLSGTIVVGVVPSKNCSF